MTPLPVIANTFRVALNWTSNDESQIATNVIHVRGAALGADDIGLALDAAWQDNQWAAMPEHWAFNVTQITPLNGTGATLDYETLSPHQYGRGGATWLPAGAAVVQFGTGLRGKENRGRVFLGPVSEAQTADGALTGSVAATIQGGWQAFATALSVGSIEHVVASYKLAVAHTVTQYTVKSALGTQRRRQTRVRYP